MKAFVTNQSKIYWIKIANGKLAYWNGNENLCFDDMQGKIVDVYFKENEYQGTKFVECLFSLICDEERYILSVRTDTGYFRSFCNYLKNCDLKRSIVIRPKITEKDGRKNYSVFVQQDGNWLKAFYNKDNPIPVPVKIIHAGDKKYYDNTEQLKFWEEWLKDQFKPDESDDLPF